MIKEVLLETPKDIRNKAIKEFAERLKREMNTVKKIYFDDCDYDFIDNLVREMVGEDK